MGHKPCEREPFAPGAQTPWPDDLVKRRMGFSYLARPAHYSRYGESYRTGEER
jgi:hypothetical protein